MLVEQIPAREFCYPIKSEIGPLKYTFKYNKYNRPYKRSRKNVLIWDSKVENLLVLNYDQID